MNSTFSDKNSPSPPKGFHYFPDFISTKEETFLLQHLEKIHWEIITMYGVNAKRRVAHFGLQYKYESRSVALTTKPPDFLHFLIERVANLMKIDASEISEILITDYPPGSSIGWHKDNMIFGDCVVGVSLGSPCILKLRIKKNATYEIFKHTLDPRSAYLLSEDARLLWQHSIPPLKQTRYSITFRTLRNK